MAASGNLLNHKFDTVNDGQSKIFVGSEKYPVLKNFMELIAAFFKAGRICIDAFADGNFPIVRAIIGQNFIRCMAHGGVYVVQQHDTPPWVLLQKVLSCGEDCSPKKRSKSFEAFFYAIINYNITVEMYSMFLAGQF